VSIRILEIAVVTQLVKHCLHIPEDLVSVIAATMLTKVSPGNFLSLTRKVQVLINDLVLTFFIISLYNWPHVSFHNIFSRKFL